MVPNDRLAPSHNGTLETAASSRSTAEQLLHYFKRIADAWTTAEEKLASTRVPIDVRVKVGEGLIEEPDGTVSGDYTRYLSYCKTKGLRRICVVDFNCEINSQETEVNIRPVSECPVDVRIKMFDDFCRLYAEAESVAKSYIPKLKEAVEKFEKDLRWLDF